jgi:chemotaxis protein methyltransferase CheR
VAFTFFFRDQHVLDLIVKHAGPSLAGRTRARVWDAGCAMGPEPYSLAILLAESMGYFAFNNLRIDASDLDDCGLFGPIIGSGTYPWEELERVPAELFRKYFEPAGEKRFKVVDRVRSRLRFHRHDLLSLTPIGEDYNLIVCKNVLLHFQPAERVEVFKMFHGALAPGGYLATEQTQKLPPELGALFHQVVSDGQVFQKVDAVCATAA